MSISINFIWMADIKLQLMFTNLYHCLINGFKAYTVK